jgi:hypothetical protein
MEKPQGLKIRQYQKRQWLLLKSQGFRGGVGPILDPVSRTGTSLMAGTEAEFLDEIQTKVLRAFLHAIHRHIYSFALRFLSFLQTHVTSYYFFSKVDVH